ncbi:hypothetical protein BH20ACI4_BH20ACI4_19750 [soil metagenome]
MKKFALAVVILIVPIFTFSQTAALKTTRAVLTDKEQTLQIRKLQIVSMVEKTAEETSFWEDKKTAVEVLTEAADLLWKENPNQSAKWLTRAWNMIGQVAESEKDEVQKQFFNRSDRSKLKTIVLSVAQKHDPNLAEKFLKEVSAAEDEEKKRGVFDDKTARSEQFLRLAQQAVETNPELAFSLAQKSLTDGISYGLQNVLTSLRQKDVKLANRLFDAALTRFTNSTADTLEAQILAGYLFKSGFTFGTNSNGSMILVVNPEQQNLPPVAQSEPLRAKNFLGAAYQKFFSRPIVVNSAEDRTAAENTLVLGTQIIAYYSRYAPELSQPVLMFIGQLQSQLSPNKQNRTNENDSKLSSLPKDATEEEIYEALIADLVSKAEKTDDPIAKKIAYIKAANTTKPEDFERGLKIAEAIDDDNLRKDAVSFLLYRAALHFVEKNEPAQAEEIASRIKEVLRRSVVKIAVAQALLERQKNKNIKQFQLDVEKRRAFDLLDEVERDLRKEDVSPNVIKILFGATAVMGRFDSAQALGFLEIASQAINSVEKYNLKSDAAPRLGIEISKTSSVTVRSPQIGFGFRSAIEPFVETEFEKLLPIISRFNDKEVRGIGYLELAKLFFQKNDDAFNYK